MKNCQNKKKRNRFSTTDAYTRVSREVEYRSYKDLRKTIEIKIFDAEGFKSLLTYFTIELF